MPGVWMIRVVLHPNGFKAKKLPSQARNSFPLTHSQGRKLSRRLRCRFVSPAYLGSTTIAPVIRGWIVQKYSYLPAVLNS